MPEFFRSIATRLRARVADRRSAPRRALRLPCVVLIHDPRHAAVHAGRAPRLDAFTRDLSATGLGIVAPAIRIADRYLTDSALLILIEHPTGTIELLATLVRYERLEADGGDAEHGYLLGLRISEMSDSDRARYDELLSQLR